MDKLGPIDLGPNVNVGVSVAPKGYGLLGKIGLR